MGRTGGGAGGANEKIEVKEDHEWIEVRELRDLLARTSSGESSSAGLTSLPEV
jgi:hypothetical protein